MDLRSVHYKENVFCILAGMSYAAVFRLVSTVYWKLRLCWNYIVICSFKSSQVENKVTYSEIYGHSHKTAFSIQNHTWIPLLDTSPLHKCWTKSTQKHLKSKVPPQNHSVCESCESFTGSSHLDVTALFISQQLEHTQDNTGNWWNHRRRSDHMYPAWKMNDHKNILNWEDKSCSADSSTVLASWRTGCHHAGSGTTPKNYNVTKPDFWWSNSLNTY